MKRLILITLTMGLVAACDSVPWNTEDEATITVADPDAGSTADAGPAYECSDDSHCDDGFDFTVDTCDRNGECQNELEAGRCFAAADCSDDNVCTTETCTDTRCTEPAKIICPAGLTCSQAAGGICVATEQDCDGLDDGNPCTVDSCEPLTGEAIHVERNCADDKPETIDSCDEATGGCVHAPINCSDDDACTKDRYDVVIGGCVNEPIECPTAHVCSDGTCVFECSANAECDDKNVCTMDYCEVGECKHDEQDCSDGNATTIDECLQIPDPTTNKPYTCKSSATECTGGCDDDNACTVDYCGDNGACVNTSDGLGGAGTVCDPEQGYVPAPCQASTDCTGGKCQTGTCEYGLCVYVEKTCPDGQVCNGGDGQCVQLEGPDCPDGCDDGNDATLDYCEAGECKEHQPVACDEPGTGLNPSNGKCEIALDDPTCTDGTIQCQQFESLGLQTVAVCQGGQWFIVQSCGAVQGSLCVGATCITP